MKDQIEKQAIEEMAQTIANLMYADCNDVPFSDMRAVYDNICRANVVSCMNCKIARGLTDKGYRKQAWISVKEQLPKLDTMVLVFTMRGSFEVARYNIYHNGTLPLWMTNEGIWKNEIITHWMPLPEAPEMKGGE